MGNFRRISKLHLKRFTKVAIKSGLNCDRNSASFLSFINFIFSSAVRKIQLIFILLIWFTQYFAMRQAKLVDLYNKHIDNTNLKRSFSLTSFTFQAYDKQFKKNNKTSTAKYIYFQISGKQFKFRFSYGKVIVSYGKFSFAIFKPQNVNITNKHKL